MYIAVSTMNKVKCGEPLVMKADRLFDEVGVYTVGGEFIGYVGKIQPEGCLQCDTVRSLIGDNRVFCKSAVDFDGTLIVSTDSPVFNTRRYIREEVAGYVLLTSV